MKSNNKDAVTKKDERSVKKIKKYIKDEVQKVMKGDENVRAKKRLRILELKLQEQDQLKKYQKVNSKLRKNLVEKLYLRGDQKTSHGVKVGLFDDFWESFRNGEDPIRYSHSIEEMEKSDLEALKVPG